MKLTNLLKNLVNTAKTPQPAAEKPATPAPARPNPSGRGDRFEGGARGAGGAGGAPPTPPPSPEPTHDEQYANAVRQLDKHFDLLDTAAGKGKKDGKLSEKDLKAALDNPTLPTELREACRFLLENKEAFKQLDLGAGKGFSDGIISKKDVAAQLAKLPDTPQMLTASEWVYQTQLTDALKLVNTHFDLLDTAAKGGKADGKVSEKDLTAAMNSASMPQDLRDACRFLLENKAALHQLDVGAGKGKVDGIISKQDVEAVLLSTNKPMDTLDFSSMQVHFDNLWNQSFPGPEGVATEHGGTIASGPSGDINIVNMQAGNAGSFPPDLNVGEGQKVQGIFHTHPYDSGDTGIALSGGDAAYLINSGQNFIIAQSGAEQFMYMRTDATPEQVDFTALNDAHNERIWELCDNGMSFSEASKQAAKETAQAYGLAYYEGSNGIFQRVE